MRKCELCENTSFTQIASRIREGDGTIIKCDSCSLIVQALDWQTKNFHDYYENTYQETNSLAQGTLQSAKAHFEDRLQTVEPLYQRVLPLLKPELEVLDIGCGAGALLSKIKPEVKSCCGVELHSPYINFINQELGIQAYLGEITDIPKGKMFDLITIIDTIDHVPSPNQVIISMLKHLRPGGKIYIEAPNRQEALNLYIQGPHKDSYQTFFWHLAHVHYFTRKTLRAFMDKFKLVSNITCFHNYTLKNFLHWYFTGKPQPSFTEGCLDINMFAGNSQFETTMNNAFNDLETVFRQVMADTFSGDTLSCLAWRK